MDTKCGTTCGIGSGRGARIPLHTILSAHESKYKVFDVNSAP